MDASRLRIIVLAATFATATGAAAQSASQHDAKAHRHAQGEALKNPVAATPESVALGERLFAKHCSECHGDGGKGDGMMAEDLKTKPADLTDGEWKHGSTDGEIFLVIRDGTKQGMKKFGDKLSARQIWSLVNFLRTLAPQPAKSH